MISYLLDILVLSLALAFMLIILMYGWRVSNKTRFSHAWIVGVVFFFAFYKVVMYYGLPLLLGMLTGFRYVIEDGYTTSGLAYLYMIEALSWVPWLFGFLLIAFIKKNRCFFLVSADFVSYQSSAAKVLLTLMTLMSIPYRLFAGNYLSDVDYGLPFFLEVFKSLLIYGGPPAGILLLVLGLTRWGMVYTVFGIIGTIFSLATISTRGALIYGLVFFLLVGYFLVSKKQRFLLIAGTTILGFIIFYLSVGGLPQLVLEPDPSGKLQFSTKINVDKRGSRSTFDEIEWRFGASSRMSIAFINMYDQGDGAGISPIKHSFYGFLPRSINPDKPIPSTLYPDDIYSQGMYLIYRQTYGYNTFSMVEFSSGGHAYWEFGWLGVLLLPFITGIYVGLCAYYFRFFGIASLALIMVVFKPFGYVDPKIWVSDIVMQLYQIILPLGLLYFLWIFARKLKIFLHAVR